MLSFIRQYIARKKAEKQWKRNCKEFNKHYSNNNFKDNF